ncbi:MAG: DivIVA domain-containing protein [Coprobacillaceae bacterium]
MEEFKTQFCGYKKTQVDEALSSSKREVQRLEKQLAQAQEELQRVSERNNVLEKQIDITEKTNEEIARLALKEASELIDKAKRNANMILKESLEYVRNLSGEMSEFRDQAVKFRTSVQKMSEDIIETIDRSDVFNYLTEEEEEQRNT